MPEVPLDRADLAKDPAASVRMPGAEELLHVGNVRRMTIDGQQRAFDGRIFGVMVPSAELIAHYDRELLALGWQRERATGLSTVELELRSWCKPKLWFRLGIADKERAFDPALYRGRDFVTVFDARLVGVDPKSECPGREP
jgi:hypothetical protein